MAMADAQGLDLVEISPNAAPPVCKIIDYKKFIYEQKFGLKDYFWPIYTPYIEVNPNLVQNIGW